MLILGTTATLWQLMIAKYCIIVGYYKGRDLQTATVKWAKMIQCPNKNLNKNNSNIDIVIIRMGWDKGCQNSLFTFRILQCSGAGWHRFSVPSLGAPAQEPRCKVVTVVIMKVQCINPLVLCQTSTCYKGIWVWWLHLIFYMYVDWQWILILSHACMEILPFWLTCWNCVNALCESCYYSPVNSIIQ